MSGGESVLENLFKYLGLLGLVGGAILVIFGLVGFPMWNSGDAVNADALLAGGLFVVMGIGFITFGMMIKTESWEKAEN
ncbi:MAG: hypothetical protein ACPHID_02290 [Thermoplasmatota archaeon]